MKTLWLWYLPLLFLPNFGMGRATGFGTLELSDFLILPYIVLLLLAGRSGPRIQARELTPLMVAFVGWALVSTVSMAFRYDYLSSKRVIFGLLKLAKFLLYGYAGYLTAKVLSRLRDREPYVFSLLAAGVIVGGALLAMGNAAATEEATEQGYKATNATSVLLSILITFCAGYLVAGQASKRWRTFAGPGLIIMAAGMFLTAGRGGWLAAAAGVLYVLYRVGMKQQMVIAIVVGSITIGVAYQAIPGFKRQVELTFAEKNPYITEVGGTPLEAINEGGRLKTWLHEMPHLMEAPILGTGFHHRGGQSGLWETGSHNFWLQIFLETGLIGGIIMLLIFRRMWRHARAAPGVSQAHRAPMEGALLAAFIGGMGGEYFYGGAVMLGALLVYAPAGACALKEKRRRTASQAGRPAPGPALTSASPQP